MPIPTQGDFFQKLQRRISPAEAAEGFAKLKADVQGMDFAADTMRGICRAGAQGWPRHKWGMDGLCGRCGDELRGALLRR